MFIQQTIHALTGYDGSNGWVFQRGLSPQEQRDYWAFGCLQAEGALAGLTITAIYASYPENRGPGSGVIIPLFGLFSMYLGSQIMHPVYYVSKMRQATGLLAGNPLGYVVDGTLLGTLLAAGSLDPRSMPFCVALGTGMGAGVAAIAMVVSSIAKFNR